LRTRALCRRNGRGLSTRWDSRRSWHAHCTLIAPIVYQERSTHTTAQLAADAVEESCLRDIVRRHGIVCELRPEVSCTSGQQVHVGFDLDLYSVHEHPERVVPACPECQTTFRDLERIARTLAPRGDGPCEYTVRPFDRSFHLAPEHEMRTEVRLTMRIQHRHGALEAEQACECGCTEEMRAKLARLGVPHVQ